MMQIVEFHCLWRPQRMEGVSHSLKGVQDRPVCSPYPSSVDRLLYPVFFILLVCSVASKIILSH